MKGKNQIFGALSASIAVATFAALSSQAQVITLTDNNSLARVDVGTQSGMFHWDIQGQNQLAQQWFWYRIGNNPEQSIDTIGAPVLGLVTANHLDVTYFGAGFNVKIGYNLAGGQVMGAGQVGE